MTNVTRVLALIGTALFAWMAVIQFNDPDPLYWFTVYAATAIVTLAVALGRPLPRFALVVLGLVIAGMLIAAPGILQYVQSGDFASINDKMRPDKPYIESAREFIGLAIAGTALLALLRRRT